MVYCSHKKRKKKMSKNYQQIVKDLHNKGFTQSEIAYKIPEIPFPLLQKLMIKLRAEDEVEEEEKRHWEFLTDELEAEAEEVEPKEYNSLIKLKKEERTNSIEEDIEEKYISLIGLEEKEKEITDDNSSEEK